ncbi:RNA-binding protein 34-like isoform X1 [Oculina patagonica]
MASSSTRPFVGYRVGEISQALVTKDAAIKSDSKENGKLNALFTSARVFQPAFVPIISKISKKAKEKTQEGHSPNEEPKGSEGQMKAVEGFSHRARKRKNPSSNDEDEKALDMKTRRKSKKSNEVEEDPERLARTVFVGNLPVTFTRKKLKKLFSSYGDVESVRFRSAALAKPDLSRKVAMKKREFHSERHNINGYVVFQKKECAVKSLKSNGMEVDGFHIRVDLTGQNDKHDHSRSIFVGNLPFDTEEEALREAFVECGDVEAVRIVRDSKTGAGKGFGFILFKERDAVMFALKRNKTEFHGRRLRVFPSSENPQLGQIKGVKKGGPVMHSFSGITATKARKNDHKGKQKHAFKKGHQENQGFGKKSARNTLSKSKNFKFQNHGNSKIHNHKNKTRTSKISKQKK